MKFTISAIVLAGRIAGRRARLQQRCWQRRHCAAGCTTERTREPYTYYGADGECFNGADNYTD